MTAEDLPRVVSIATQVHASYPEDVAVFAERLRLYPAGCRVIDNGDLVSGYVFSHPWRHRAPPRLNSLLGALPESPDTYYIHDLVLLPDQRGSGAGSAIVERLIAHARTSGFTNLSLVALPRPAAFWQRHGFRFLDDPGLTAALLSYGPTVRYMVRDESW